LFLIQVSEDPAKRTWS